MNPTLKRLLLLLLPLGAIAAALTLLTSSPPTPSSTPPHPALNDPGWKDLTPAHTVKVKLTDHALTLHLGSLTFAPTPTLPHTRDLRWTHTTTDQGTHLLQGRGTWQGHPLLWQWTLHQGDPQTTLSLSLGPIPWHTLDQPVVATLPLPEDGSLTWLDPTYTPAPFTPADHIDPWQGDSLTFTLPNAPPITWSNLHLDRLTAPNPHTLLLTLFDPKAHPFPPNCDLPLLLSARWTMTLGTPLRATVSRLPDGHLAALSPTFVDPSFDPDSPFGPTAARTPGDLARRIQTLQFGHSDPKDPRYGNGGLSGLHAGASFAIPKAWAREKEIDTLRTLLAPTRSTLSLQGDPTPPTPPYATFLSKAPLTCDTLSAPNSSLLLLPSLPLPLDDPEGVGSETVVLPPHPQHPSLLPLPLHPGTRSLYDTHTFAPHTLAALLASRGTSWLLAPLVAERNPLTPAFKQTLLDPETGGHWTLSSPLTQALSTVELLNEEPDLLIAPPHTLFSHWLATTHLSIHHDSQGGLLLHNPHATPLPGFTLILPGPPLTPKGLTPTRQRTLHDSHGDPQTWITWTLPPGLTTLDLKDAPTPPLTGISWHLDSE